MSKRVYISGKMSGIPDMNFPAFHRAASRLRSIGYFVINPAEMNSIKEMEWAEYLADDIRLMLHCDGIAMLPGWDDSRGARLELAIALKMDKFVLCAETLEPLDVTCDLKFSVKDTLAMEVASELGANSFRRHVGG